MQPAKPRPTRIRNDGWTPSRQLAFLDILARTRSVSPAASAVGMSREGAYRLRRRPDGALFAAAWDRVMRAGRVTFTRAEVDKGHSRVIARARATEGVNLRLRLAAPSTS